MRVDYIKTSSQPGEVDKMTNVRDNLKEKSQKFQLLSIERERERDRV